MVGRGDWPRIQLKGDDGPRSVSVTLLRSVSPLGYVQRWLVACLVVEPRQLPVTHPLAQVEGADNVVVVTTVNAGRLVFAGPGAGGLPTASAVVADLARTSAGASRTAGPVVPA